ncbi:hypothetical protein ABDK56_07530 [Sphingomonas sp. ASV193]|uniref:hypothetical protein n=1 Tax=Sphingomonas sp. ASV193 TaxID=3144405 RepID=UPI0032E8E84F
MNEPLESRRAPWHLWLVGALALLWNGFGAWDYAMTRTRGAAYIRDSMPGVDADRVMAYIDGFPLWASIGWGLGVWGGLAGALLLLGRHRWAVPLLALSFVGALLGIGYQIVRPIDLAQAKQGFNAVVPYLIIVVAGVLAWYASGLRARGVLR